MRAAGREIFGNDGAASLYADARVIWDPVETSKALARVFPDLDPIVLSRKLATRQAFVWIKRDLKYGFYAAGGAQFQSARYTSASDAVTLPSFVTFDLGAGYHGKNVDVALTLDNLFDRKYFIAAHGNADMYNMPGAPRTLTVSARWHM